LQRPGTEKTLTISKPYDAIMRKLIELEPAAWLRFLHVPVADPDCVRVIDSNLSTVTAEADKVLRVDEPEPWIEHVELQAGRDIGLPGRLHWYNTSLGYHHRMPVHTTIILLRLAADGPDLGGTYERRYRRGDVYDWFRYDVKLSALRDLDQLDVLLDRVLDVSTWDELLASPGPDA
jgi:hypothetical protein